MKRNYFILFFLVVTLVSAQSAALVTVSSVITQPLCPAGTGSVSLTISGGNSPYEYQLNGSGTWSTIVSGETITGIPDGAFSIDVRDFMHSPALPVTGVINVPTTINATATPMQPLCSTGYGSIIISSLSGGTPGYQYSLNGGSWLSLTNDQVLHNISDGLYAIYVRDANQCLSAPIMGSIDVPQAAALSLISGSSSQTVCVNTAITPIVYTYTGGAYDATVSGNLNGLTVTKDVVSKTVTISGVASSNTNFTVTTVGPDASCSSQSLSAQVNLSSLPVPSITGNNSLCAGAVGLVYSTEAGMSSYSWSVSSGGTISSVSATNQIEVEWDTAGEQTVSVNYANSNGCIATSPTIYNVTVNPIPNAPLVQDYAICKTTGIISFSSLVAQPSSGDLVWYNYNFGGSSVVPSLVDKSAVGSTTMYVAVRIALGCESPIVPSTITIHSLPIVSVDKTDVSNVLVQASNGTAPYDYTVGDKSGIFLGMANIGALVDNNYKCVISDANGCKDSTSFVIGVSAAINEADKLAISVFPNPVKDEFTIDGFKGLAQMYINDINGKQILTKEINEETRISIENFPSAVYILKLITDKGVFEKKIIKE